MQKLEYSGLRHSGITRCIRTWWKEGQQGKGIRGGEGVVHAAQQASYLQVLHLCPSMNAEATKPLQGLCVLR